METFNKCIQTLRQGKTDNEKLAALMVISKITHTLDVNKALTEQLYEALSKTFLLRLLKSSTHGDDNSAMFRQLALTVLGVIVKVNPGAINTDREILKQLTDILKVCQKDDTLREDVLEILTIVSADAAGCVMLLEHGILDSVAVHEDGSQKDVTLLMTILEHEGCSKAWSSFLLKHSEVLVNNQELKKFKELTTINRFVDVMCEGDYYVNTHMEGRDTFIRNTCSAAQDLLKSRIKPEYKQTIISLLSSVVKLFGLDALLKEAWDKAGVWLLILTVVSVELACLFNLETAMQTLMERKDFIRKSCHITKSFLIHICSEAFEDDKLANDSKFIVNTFETLKNIMTSVYCFLRSHSHHSLDNPILLDALTMVCVWATEETESLQEELKSTIPLLLKVAEFYVDSKETNDATNDFFTSLIPCLSQILPDENLRKVLVSNNKFLSVIQQYTIQQLTTENNNQSRSPTLECLIHFYHEMIILAPAYCKATAWSSELTSGLVALYKRSPKSLQKISMYSQSELLIILLRLPLTELPLASLLPIFLKDLLSFGEEMEDMKDCFEEIWFIGVQAFTEVIATNKNERERLRANKDVRAVLESSALETGCGREFIAKCKKVLYG